MGENIALKNQNIEELFQANDGTLAMHEVEAKLDELGLSRSVKRDLARAADRNRDGYLTYEEYRGYVENPRRPSNLRMVLAAAARSVASRKEVENYLDHYNCMPPPLFILTITIAEISVFIYYALKLRGTDNPVTATSGLDHQSPLIFDPQLRHQAWRFVSYMFMHFGYVHLISNMVFQLLIGLPLELVHKCHRVCIVYTLGVIAGSLGSSIFDPKTNLVGASGGSYALVGAHFAIIFMNYKEMRFSLKNSIMQALLSAPVRLFFWTTLVGIDFGTAIFQRYYGDGDNNVSFTAHLMGFLTGVLVGTPVLKNLVVKTWEKYFLWISVLLYAGFFTAAVLYNVFGFPL